MAAIIAALWALSPTAHSQCLNSSLVLDSMRLQAGVWEVYATACIGAGTNGVVSGGLADTRNFFFGFYSTSPTFAMTNFFPPFIFGDTTIYYNNGTQFGPVGAAPFNGTRETLGFTGGAGTFTCVSSRITCGLPHQDCTQYIFYLTEIPDSIRLFGAEANNVYAGNCYPETQMLLTFGGLMPVVWGSFDVEPMGDGVSLNWSTERETATHRFEVMHSSDGVQFNSIGTVPSAGNTRRTTHYQFMDTGVNTGTHYYRIDEYDLDGSYQSTTVRTVQVGDFAELAWKGGFPNPADGEISLQFETDGTSPLTVAVFDASMRKMMETSLMPQPGLAQLPVDTRQWAPGLYHVRARAGATTLTQRILIAR